MLSQELLDVLVCPRCKGELEYDRERERLICHACKLAFAIKGDIPIMLLDEAEHLGADPGDPSGASAE